MKAWVKGLGGLVLVGGGLLACLIVVTGDRYLPWVPREPLYVATSEAQGERAAGGGYQYHATALKANGQAVETQFYAPRRLRPGAYLKLDAKGNYIASWEEVSQSDLPRLLFERWQ